MKYLYITAEVLFLIIAAIHLINGNPNSASTALLMSFIFGIKVDILKVQQKLTP